MPSTFKPYLISDSSTAGMAPSRDDVGCEALRRISAANRLSRVDAKGARELHYLTLQIEYVAERLSVMEPIPADFRADYYWPSMAVERDAGLA